MSAACGVIARATTLPRMALSTLHHVLLGVDRYIVIDNGSTDGTLEILRAIATANFRMLK